ncbi:hypothetical protein CGZ93_08410 [Enemella dayhoffiae]|uniref:ER-bound oxygenase mpaB/mpaB'/Rubber oxygenase catalytic domain-containing protein n=1 Tax=Enemella dayhoffiae TaxID=2016507 RepID=A0A255H2Z0_9ACTN|nr:oxygenase MpaB family protein [Enemella dayhoffiae]OYO21949.1 hypothetical protein CGZ93_08410 [Enemella dayhoffiae]
MANLLQRRLGAVLRARVAGPEAAARAQDIWGTPGPRWFGPNDPIWRVHDDASMYPGGIAALLLQSLHPLAMAGVAGHSGYRSDPWGRLQRTSDYIAATTFGTIETAEQSIDTVRRVHARVRGRDERGRAYRADDPHLLRWVAVAEAYAFLRAHERYGRGSLSESEKDTYVCQAGTLAVRLGADELPDSWAGLLDVLHEYRPELEVTDAACDAAAFLLHEPPLPAVARPGYALLANGGVALLPDWARRELGLADRVGLATLSGRIGTGTVRWGLAGLTDEPDRAARRQNATKA